MKTRTTGREAKVPKVPGTDGIRPAPNQVERTRAVFPARPAFL